MKVDSYLLLLTMLGFFLLIGLVILILVLLFYGEQFRKFADSYYRNSSKIYEIRQNTDAIEKRIGSLEEKNTVLEMLSRVSQHLYEIKNSFRK